MAVFFVNNCTFQGCGLTFATLADLIQHIEDSHIENDPRVILKQEILQPQSLALSYVLRFFTEAAKRETPDFQKKRVRAQSPAVSLPGSTPTGSEIDEEEIVSDDEDSDDSWTTQEEFSSELIMSMMGGSKDNDGDKPFACPVPGCKKRYKNVNGIKYHARHGHKKEAKFVIRKTFKCFCGKSYKTSHGLRSHSVVHHQTPTDCSPSSIITSLPSNIQLKMAVVSSSTVPQGIDTILITKDNKSTSHLSTTTSAILSSSYSAQLNASQTSSLSPITVTTVSAKPHSRTGSPLSLANVTPIQIIARPASLVSRPTQLPVATATVNGD
ncbi:juxtaposed with another zinc finger protein 1 [Patella vulgata]|uniref:juxtaposed with another zinc finger protein 1 n=1 Tax=Patella vulgata TaxID=6465 RepID=UPI00217F9C0B|nr:juxtaposed with another zinc finger protein 1 [Patella vulgata]